MPKDAHNGIMIIIKVIEYNARYIPSYILIDKRNAMHMLPDIVALMKS